MIAAQADTWMDILALVVTGIVVLGAAYLGSDLVGRRRDKKADARTERSVRLHRAAFDGPVDELKQQLVDIAEFVEPLAAQQKRAADVHDEIARDIRGMRADMGGLRGDIRALHAVDRDHEQRLADVERRRPA